MNTGAIIAAGLATCGAMYGLADGFTFFLDTRKHQVASSMGEVSKGVIVALALMLCASVLIVAGALCFMLAADGTLTAEWGIVLGTVGLVMYLAGFIRICLWRDAAGYDV